jgi:O-antigen/teichoic acid export membrane protein
MIRSEPDAVDRRRTLAWDATHGPGNYLTIVVAHIVGSAAAFGATWLAARLLGVSGYGVVAALMAVSQGLMQTTLHWSAPALERFGCVEFIRTGRLATAFWTRALILVPNLVVIGLTVGWWLPAVRHWIPLPASVAALVLVHCIGTSLWVHVHQGLLATKSPRVAGVLLAAERFAILALLLLLAGTVGASPFTVVAAYIIASVSMTVIGLWVLRSLVFHPVRVDVALAREMLRFSLPLIPRGVLGHISANTLDALFIVHFLSVQVLAPYWVAYQVAGVFLQFALLAGTLLLPVFVTLDVERRDHEVRRLLADTLPLISLVWTALCALACAVAGALVPLVFGADYAIASALVWPLMAAGVVASPALIAYYPYLKAVSATGAITLGACVGAVVNAGLDVLLIPAFGLLGCAWATAAAYGAAALAVAYAIERRVPVATHRTLETAVPMVVGAAFASWSGSNLGALVAAWLGCAAVAGLRSRSLADGLRALRSAGVLASAHRLLPHRARSAVTR